MKSPELSVFASSSTAGSILTRIVSSSGEGASARSILAVSSSVMIVMPLAMVASTTIFASVSILASVSIFASVSRLASVPLVEIIGSLLHEHFLCLEGLAFGSSSSSDCDDDSSELDELSSDPSGSPEDGSELDEGLSDDVVAARFLDLQDFFLVDDTFFSAAPRKDLGSTCATGLADREGEDGLDAATSLYERRGVWTSGATGLLSSGKGFVAKRGSSGDQSKEFQTSRRQ
ncbi:hypothetical protein CVT25_009443 [Psilocybe cyanescens]|uniref:Uncharacterized protein n=1 Tax=Psilocybe cyanescens TaxID=93625 RepID=A0A409WVY9_PSICY|nr:hypothetical protein CVT25_009443 [Psilocybe cyanescens]